MAGEVLADRFELIEEVQRGGMGTIFRGRDRTSGKPVAIKVLRVVQDEDVARFAQEAEVLAELSETPGIVRHVAHAVGDGGPTYLAMEWLDGVDLRRRLRQRPLDVAEAIALGRRVSTILATIHERGLVHRDVKPSNIFLRGGRIEDVVLLDFGVVLRGEGHGVETRSGFLVGTPAYMAPEQVRSEATLDGRADLFALGCVLYACLVGRPPFSGESHVAVLTKILLEQPVPIEETRGDLPVALTELVGRLLAKSPVDRPASANELEHALATIDAGSPIDRDALTMPPPALGVGEQRFLTLLLARAREGAPLPKIGADLRRVALSFGATIERLIDGSLVAWIDVGAATDQASQAAQLALALRQSLPEASIAIATARGVVSERLPVGEVIDRAAASTQSAGDAVLLDEVTAGLLDDRFVIASADGGLALVGLREAAPGQRTLLGKPTPCVGRERELDALQALIDECVEEPSARAVLVVGEAGIGKSRIRSELAQRLKHRDTGVVQWMARGDPLSAGSPFGLVRRALRDAIGAREGDALEAQALRLASFVKTHVPPEDQESVGEFVGEIVGIPLAPTPSARLVAARSNAVLMGDQLRRAFEALIVAVCRKRPLALVIEDLHWGDLPTVRLVETALRATRDLPFFVLALARPEVNERFPRLWEAAGLTTIHVAGLGKRAAARLVREALGEGVDDALVDRLVERAAGHAFTLEELVRAAAAGKAEAELPETVLAMMQRRVDEIAPAARRLLRAASAFGPSFWASGVAELVGRPADASLLHTLDGLATQELVQRRSASRFRGEIEWGFRHALLREAVYATLTDADRILAHRLAGAWLVRAGERDAITIAEHFERGHAPDSAAQWYLRAAERALAGNDWHEGITCAERGLPLAENAEATASAKAEIRGALHLALAQACAWSGDVRRAEREALEAAERLERGSGPWFDAVAEIVTAAGMGLGHVDLTRTWADAMLEAWDRVDDVQAAAIAAARAITPLLLAGDRARAKELLRRVEALALSGMPLAEAHLARARASMAFRGDKDLGAYVEFTRTGIDWLEVAGDERTLAQQRTNLGYALTLLGAPETEQVLEDGIREAERLGLPLQAGTHRQNLGLVLMRKGRLAEALATERASIDTFRAAGDKRFEAASHVYLATILEAARDWAGAESAAKVALAIGASYPARRATALAALAAARLGRGESELALEAAREGMTILAELGALEEGEEKLRFVHAQALRATGATEAADEALAVARAKLRERAARIADPTWRASFLANVPENVMLLGD